MFGEYETVKPVLETLALWLYPLNVSRVQPAGVVEFRVEPSVEVIVGTADELLGVRNWMRVEIVKARRNAANLEPIFEALENSTRSTRPESLLLTFLAPYSSEIARSALKRANRKKSSRRSKAATLLFSPCMIERFLLWGDRIPRNITRITSNKMHGVRKNPTSLDSLATLGLFFFPKIESEEELTPCNQICSTVAD